ncbi:MAG: hypothetical protein MJA83_11305 [Gammaproteobacteria bacterium]|nr:hypothetical protein [Gammaproteobacteria bacterium]
MPEEINRSLANHLESQCKALLEECDITAARVKSGREVNRRTFKKGQIAELLNYLVEEKTEEEEVLIWPSVAECREDNWKVKYPAGMKSWHERQLKSVEQRRAGEFSSLVDGITLKQDTRSGYLYYKENDRLLEIYVEMSAVKKYDFLLSWEGLNSWVYPEKVETTDEERKRLQELVENWLNEKAYKVNSPEPA